MNDFKNDLQYNDLKGLAALNFYDSSTELIEYAKSVGVELEKYEPIGLNIYYGENGFFELSFLAIDKEKRIDNEKELGKLPLVELKTKETREEFESKFKRFSINLLLKGRNIDEYEIVDSRDVNDFEENEEE